MRYTYSVRTRRENSPNYCRIVTSIFRWTNYFIVQLKLDATFLISISILLSTPLFAATRIKTVEFNYGSWYGNNVPNGIAWSPPYIPIDLPESGITIKNAFLEFGCISIDNVDTTGIDISFDQNTTATNVRDVIGAGLYIQDSGEAYTIKARCDVTNVIAGASWPGAFNFASKVVITGPPTNSHTLKLYITYEYDDTSTAQLKTVRFPLFSGTNTASYEAQQSLGINPSFTYNAELADGSLSDVVQAWFEITGYRQKTNGSVYTQIAGAAADSTMTLTDGGLADSFEFFYLSSTGIPSGFDINTNSTVQVFNTGFAVNYLGGEVVVTYKFSKDAGTKTKTVKYFLGQGTLVSTAYTHFRDIFLNETGITIKRLYARLISTLDSATAGSANFGYSVGSSPSTERSYSGQATAAQVSGFTIFLDIGQYASSWVNGSSVTVTTPANAALGGTGAELIVTYDYTAEGKYTENYCVLAGQSIDEVAANTWTSGTTADGVFHLYFPDPETPVGRKDLRTQGAYIELNGMSSDGVITGDSNASQALNTTASNVQTVYLRTATEDYGFNCFYENQGQISTETVTLGCTSYHRLTGDPTSFTAKTNITYDYTPCPSTPTALIQYKTDDVTIIPLSKWTNQSSIILKGTIKSKFSGDTITLKVENKPLSTAFNGTTTNSGFVQNYTGTDIVSSVTVSGLTTGTSYHWQASVTGIAGTSTFVSFGGNAESAIDYGVDLNAPSQPNLSLPIDNFATNYQTPKFSWATSSDAGGSFLANYEILISTDINFGVINYTATPTGTEVVPTALSEYKYFWKVRAKDNAENWCLYSDTRAVIIDITAPPKPATLSLPLDNLTTNYQTPFFDWSDETDVGPAGTECYQLWVATSTDFTTVTYSTSPVLSQVTSELLAQNTYWWKVRTKDKAGNYSGWTSTRTFLLDITAPDYPTLTSPADNFTTNYALITFKWIAVTSDPGNSGVSNYEIRVSTADNFYPVVYSSSPVGIEVSTTLAQNKYYWNVRTFDKAGNYSNYCPYWSVILDTTPPRVEDLQTGDDTWQATDPGAIYNIKI